MSLRVPKDMDESKLNLETLGGWSLILVDFLGSLGHVPRFLQNSTWNSTAAKFRMIIQNDF